MNRIHDDRRVGKKLTNASESHSSTSTTKSTSTAASPPSPFPTSNEPIASTYQVTAHEVKYVRSNSPLNTPTVQQLLALSANKSQTHKNLLNLLRSTEDKSLEHRLASILLSRNNSSVAERIKAYGRKLFGKKNDRNKEKSSNKEPIEMAPAA